MQTGFTIDDVRETLTRDVTRSLGRIERTAREILDDRELACDGEPASLPRFVTISDHSHAIYGTSRLVSAQSLADSSARMEALANRGRDHLTRALGHLALVRDIAAAMVGGSTDMLAMLSLELDGQSREAQVIADSWRLRVDDVLQGSAIAIAGADSTGGGHLHVVGADTTGPFAADSSGAPPEAPAAVAWSAQPVDAGWGDFDDEPGPVALAAPATLAAPLALPAPDHAYSFARSVVESPDDELAVVDPDLAEVFAAEASSTLTVLDDALASLRTHPADRAGLKSIERGFHTLKGAAATVGLAAVSAAAADLQDRAEALVDAGRPVTADEIAGLIRDAAALRRLAGMPVAAPPAVAVVAPPAFGEVALEFAREAQLVLDEAEHLLGNARAADPTTATGITKELGVVMHRLRGSALVAGFPELAETAAGVERVAGTTPVDLDKLAAELARCAALLAAPAQPAPSLAASLAEARVVFLVEAREVIDEAAGLLPALRNGEPTARARLAWLFHRLKGSALVVEDAGLSAQAAALHQALEAAPVVSTEVANYVAETVAALTAAIGRPEAPATARRLTVPVPDNEIDPSFQLECTDLLEVLDSAALALERSERPKDQIGELLRNYHTLKGVVNALGLRPIGDELHKVEDLLEGLSASSIMPPLRAIVGVLLPFHGELRRQLRTIRLGYVELVPGQLEARIARLLARASSSPSVSTGKPQSQARSRGSRLGDGSEASDAGASTAPDRRNIRVSIERLDALMNLAGELVINRSRLLNRINWLRGLQVDLGRSSRNVLEIVEKFRDEHEFSTLARGGVVKDRAVRWSGFSDLELDRYEDVNILARSLTEGSTDLHELFGQLAGGLGSLADDSDTLGTIVSGIQSEVTRSRMVPLDVVFSRLQLPVRDAAQREGREVRIETSGTDVHLDKTIVDALFQPMLHLVRNAVSHGIEAPHVRIAAGKPAHGTVTLRARQELGQIVVEVIDDGAGLDLERLRERGAALGLVAHDLPLDDPRIRDLIFVHGLSTQVEAGSVAGRGVGCDVVRRAIDRLNGSIRVESVRHERTVFAITLPVTLAISRALLVRHAGETFAVPLYFTERIVDVHEVELVESANQRRIDIDGTFVPVRSLGEFLSGPTSPDGPILLLQVGDQRLVVQVDEVLTQEEVVVKSLGALLRGHPTFAGVTIRGTGDIVLILDVPSMTDSALGRGVVARPAAPAARRPPVLVAAPPRALAVAVDAPASDADRPLHVLFVDDSVSVRKVAERALKQLGVQVTLATDGVDALERLRGGQFDMVFTDLEMPRMHGYELIRELRFLPAYHALPIVVVTSRSGKKHRDEAHAVGASDYLTKPFTSRSLATALIKFGGARAAGLVAEGEVTS